MFVELDGRRGSVTVGFLHPATLGFPGGRGSQLSPASPTPPSPSPSLVSFFCAISSVVYFFFFSRIFLILSLLIDTSTVGVVWILEILFLRFPKMKKMDALVTYRIISDRLRGQHCVNRWCAPNCSWHPPSPPPPAPSYICTAVLTCTGALNKAYFEGLHQHLQMNTLAIASLTVTVGKLLFYSRSPVFATTAVQELMCTSGLVAMNVLHASSLLLRYDSWMSHFLFVYLIGFPRVYKHYSRSMSWAF